MLSHDGMDKIELETLPMFKVGCVSFLLSSETAVGTIPGLFRLGSLYSPLVVAIPYWTGSPRLNTSGLCLRERPCQDLFLDVPAVAGMKNSTTVGYFVSICSIVIR